MWPMFEKRGKMEDFFFFFLIWLNEIKQWHGSNKLLIILFPIVLTWYVSNQQGGEVFQVRLITFYSYALKLPYPCEFCLYWCIFFMFQWFQKVLNFYRSPFTLMIVWYNCTKFIQSSSDTPETADQKETLKIHHSQDSQTLHSTIQMNQGQFGHISQHFTNTTEEIWFRTKLIKAYSLNFVLAPQLLFT